MSSPAPFDWKSLITPALNLGFKAVGDVVAPDASLQNARTSARNSEADIEMARAKMANANQIRANALPALYTNLGYSPQQGRTMAAGYSANAQTPQNFSSGGASSGQPGLGSQIGKAALGVGLGMAPSVIGGVLKGGAGKAVSGALGGLGGLGTAATLGLGAAIPIAAYIWKKTQAHPAATEWVNTQQAPFDAKWKQLQQSGAAPDQIKQAQMQSAQNYLQALAQFQSQGGHNDVVARQAAATFRQYYGEPAKYGVPIPF